MARFIKKHKLKVTTPICPYCGEKSRKTFGSIVYPNRKDLNKIKMYACFDCDARIGCHGNTWAPLGTLANAELRSVRTKAHAAFDPIWKEWHMTRTDAYEWLSKRLDIDTENCHIGMFDVDMCNKVIDISNNFVPEESEISWYKIKNNFN